MLYIAYGPPDQEIIQTRTGSKAMALIYRKIAQALDPSSLKKGDQNWAQ